MGLLEKGANWLSEQLRTRLSHPITYRRKGKAAELFATLGRTEYVPEEVESIEVARHSTDFIFPRTTLDFGDGPTLPEKGDRIEHAGQVFEVFQIPGAQCYQFSDPWRISLRVHTQQVQ